MLWLWHKTEAECAYSAVQCHTEPYTERRHDRESALALASGLVVRTEHKAYEYYAFYSCSPH